MAVPFRAISISISLLLISCTSDGKLINVSFFSCTYKHTCTF